MKIQKRKLIMSVNFEPNRLAKTYLAKIYDTIVPLIKRTFNPHQKRSNIKRNETVKIEEGKL